MSHQQRPSILAAALLAGLASAVPALFHHSGLRAECLVAFQRGDTNRDGRLDLSDAISTLGFLFLGTGDPGCLDAADADDNRQIDITDAIYTVTHLFLGGRALPPPRLGECGSDPTDDGLTCIDYPPCESAGENPCTSNDCCEPGSYCEKAVDDCEGIGACTPRPVICPRLFDPWCGCDGATYGNRCEAAAAGVNVVHRGECQAAGCTGNEECDPGSFCSRKEGACGEPGECILRPEFCIEIYDPVCGCDEATYGNECEAAAKGVSVAYRGECRSGSPCAASGECDPGEYCFKIPGDCDGEGVCQPRPDLCAQVNDPVCGCDGRTYGNECMAAVAGMSIARRGPCEAGPPCASNADCPEESFCSRPEGFCDEPGFCATDPDPAVCDGFPPEPVCGCDGVTYQNSCLAAVAGVTVLRQGPCEDGADCKASADCAAGYYCFKKEGLCREPGICHQAPSPVDCQDEPDDPVCGCNDNTYRTACEASLQGISIAYPGPCDGIPRCGLDEDCTPGSYCAFREGFCGGLGDCTERPAECPPDFVDPVCGCDGVTYLNDCLAAMAGVSVTFRGKCDGGDVECQTSAFCGGGSYCAKADGNCDGTGRCEPLPLACGDVEDPVCGCDGITYANECQANAAGVNVLGRGACPP